MKRPTDTPAKGIMTTVSEPQTAAVTSEIAGLGSRVRMRAQGLPKADTCGLGPGCPSMVPLGPIRARTCFEGKIRRKDRP